MMKRCILLCITALLLCVTASAQPLTLEQAREMALEHNRKAQQAELTRQMAGQAVRQWRAMFLPDIGVNAGAMYSTAQGTLLSADLTPFATALGGTVQQLATAMPPLAGSLAPLAGMVPHNVALDYKVGAAYAAGVTLKQPLYTGGKIRAAYAMAAQSREMAAQNIRLTRIEVIEQTDEAYINALRAGELAKVAERYVEMLTELERNVESAVAAGMKLPSDRLRVQVKKSEVELQLRRAQNGRRLATMSLNHAIGLPLDADTTPSPSLSISQPSLCPPEGGSGNLSLPSGRAGEGAVGVRPESALMRQKVAMAAQQVRVERAEVLPQLALLANYGYTRGGEVSTTVDGRAGEAMRVLDGASFTGGVMLSVPLFHFGERAARIRSAKMKQQMAQLEAADVDEKLELALAQALCNMDEASLEVQLSQRALEQAEENLRVSRQQYEVGVMTLADLLDAQALWQQAYERKIEAHCTLHKATTALQKAQGTLQ